jgi:hypothetical protein
MLSGTQSPSLLYSLFLGEGKRWGGSPRTGELTLPPPFLGWSLWLSRTCLLSRHLGDRFDAVHACHVLLQARRLGAQELQCQAWGGSAAALEASALELLELDPDFITV